MLDSNLLWVGIPGLLGVLVALRLKLRVSHAKIFALMFGIQVLSLSLRVAATEIGIYMNREPTEATPGVIGQNYQLSLDDDQPARETFRWTASDSTVVRVGPTGVITFVGAGIADVCAVTEAHLTHMGALRVYQKGWEVPWWESGIRERMVSLSGKTCINFLVGESLKPPPAIAGGARPTSLMSVVFI